MKTKVYSIIVSFFMLAALGACTNLEEEPIGLLAPESFFQTPADAEAAVQGGYAMISSVRYYGRRLPMTLQLLSDEIDIGDIGTVATRIQTNEFRGDPGNGDYQMIWQFSYRAISAANSAIAGIPGIEMDEGRKNALIGEAKMIRALSYYHLVQLFGDVPLIEEFIDDPSSVGEIERTAASGVWDLIIEDVEYAATVLPDVQPGDIRSSVTKGTAHTMLSKIYLIHGEWSKAAENALHVINNEGTYGYGLMADYKDIWDADLGDIEEHVWTIDLLGGVTTDYHAPMTGVRGADMQGWSVTVPSPGIYTFFPDSDYRKEITFLTETLIDGEMTPYTEWTWPRIHTNKWNINAGSNANQDGSMSDHNIVIFRYAEVLLIAAEALNEANGGPTPEAYTYINRVRERARNQGGEINQFPEDLQAGMSQEEFRQAIREERILELAFEWKRWYDIKRWGIVEDAFLGPDSFEPQANFAPHRLLLPIPQQEINRNRNLSQNDGY